MLELQLEVSKVDAGVALLQTDDFNVIEFPALLLPDSVSSGSIVNIQVSRDTKAEETRLEKFKKLQREILEMYGNSPSIPAIKCENQWLNSFLLSFDFEERGSAIQDITVLANGSTVLHSIWKERQIKVTLSSTPPTLSFPLEVNIQINTTAGSFESNSISIPGLSEELPFKGFRIAVRGFQEEAAEDETSITRLVSAINRIKAQYHETIRFDTTHIVMGKHEVEISQLALEYQIPLVSAEWLYACLDFEKVVDMSEYPRMQLVIKPKSLNVTYKLMEVGEEFPTDLTIKGTMESPAYAVTRDKTYAMKQQNISNSLLLSSTATGETSSIDSSILLLERIKPDFSELLLHIPRFQLESQAGPTVKNLQDLCMSSEAELIDYLDYLKFVLLYDGRYYSVQLEPFMETLANICLNLAAANTDLDDTVEVECLQSEEDTNSPLFYFVLNRISKEPLLNFDFKERYVRKTVSIDYDVVSQFIAIKILRTSANQLSKADFMERWQSLIDEIIGAGVLVVQIAKLRGIAIVTDLGTVGHLSLAELPFNTLERLKILFGNKKRWLVDELKLYLDPVVVDVPTFVQRHTRSFDVDGMRVCTLSKSVAYSKH